MVHVLFSHSELFHNDYRNENCKVFYILSTILLKLCSAQTNSFVQIFKNPYKKLAAAIMILKPPEFPLIKAKLFL